MFKPAATWLLILALTPATNADAQTWLNLIDEAAASREGKLAVMHPIYAANEECSYRLPEELALVPGIEPLISVSNGLGRIQLTAVGVDTLRVRLVGARCGGAPDVAMVLRLDAAGHDVFYEFCQPSLCPRIEYPGLMGVEADGSLSQIRYDDRAQRTGTEGSIAAAHAEIAAADRQRLQANAAAESQRRAAAAAAGRRREQEAAAARTRKVADLRARGWSERVVSAVADRKIFIGMTSAMVLEAWGRPQTVNKTVYTFGVHEQWVYSGDYVYVEDGVVTSDQTSR